MLLLLKWFFWTFYISNMYTQTDKFNILHKNKRKMLNLFVCFKHKLKIFFEYRFYLNCTACHALCGANHLSNIIWKKIQDFSNLKIHNSHFFLLIYSKFDFGHDWKTQTIHLIKYNRNRNQLRFGYIFTKNKLYDRRIYRCEK